MIFSMFLNDPRPVYRGENENWFVDFSGAEKLLPKMIKIDLGKLYLREELV